MLPNLCVVFIISVVRSILLGGEFLLFRHVSHPSLSGQFEFWHRLSMWQGFLRARFYSISTLVGYLMPYPIFRYILNIYDLQANNLLVTLFLNEPEFICLNTVKWFQVLLFNTYNFIQLILSKRLNSSTWPINGTLTSTTNPGQTGSGSNGNEGVLQIPQSYLTLILLLAQSEIVSSVVLQY